MPSTSFDGESSASQERTDYSIEVGVIEAKSLSLQQEVDLFAIVKVNNTEKFETPKILKCSEPFWNDRQLVMLDDSFRNVTCTVYQAKQDNDKQMRKAGKLGFHKSSGRQKKGVPKLAIGSITFPSDYLSSFTGEHEQWYTLKPQNTYASGFIEIRTRYIVSTGSNKLTLYLQSARDLSVDPTRQCDSCAYVCPIPLRDVSLIQKTEVFDKENDPNYQKTFVFTLDEEVKAMYITLWDAVKSPMEFLGEVVIPIGDLQAIGLTNKLTCHSLKPKANYSTMTGGDAPHEFQSAFVTGKCHVCLEFLSGLSARKCKKCKITIHDTCSAYVGDHCSLELSQMSSTKGASDSNNNFKNLKKSEQYILQFQHLLLSQLESQHKPSREKKEHLLVSTKCFTAICRVCFKTVSPSGLKCKLCGDTIHDACSEKLAAICGSSGQVRFKFKYLKERILDTFEYKRLFSLLFQEDFYLLNVLNEVTRERDDVAIALVRAAYASNKIRDLLRGLARLDLEKMTDYNVIFRSNSLTTKSYDNFLKIFGEAYLGDMMQTVINTILEAKSAFSCELDPLRVEKEGQTVDNLVNLTALVSTILAKITTQVSKLPLLVRSVFRDLREEVLPVVTRLGAENHEEIVHIATTAFLFLRFFCPAILNPQLFGLMEGMPPEKVKRNLTLVAKTIQTIANNSQYGDKEPFMRVINDFISTQYAPLEKFIAEVCIEPSYDEVVSTQVLTGVKIDAAKELSRVYRFLAHNKEEMEKYCMNDPLCVDKKKFLFVNFINCLDEINAKHIEPEKKERSHSFSNSATNLQQRGRTNTTPSRPKSARGVVLAGYADTLRRKNVSEDKSNQVRDETLSEPDIVHRRLEKSFSHNPQRKPGNAHANSLTNKLQDLELENQEEEIENSVNEYLSKTNSAQGKSRLSSQSQDASIVIRRTPPTKPARSKRSSQIDYSDSGSDLSPSNSESALSTDLKNPHSASSIRPSTSRKGNRSGRRSGRSSGRSSKRNSRLMNDDSGSGPLNIDEVVSKITNKLTAAQQQEYVRMMLSNQEKNRQRDSKRSSFSSVSSTASSGYNYVDRRKEPHPPAVTHEQLLQLKQKYMNDSVSLMP